MCGNNDSGNSMPESGKTAKAIECLANIRGRSGASSEIVVFDSEHLNAETNGGKQDASLLFALC